MDAYIQGSSDDYKSLELSNVAKSEQSNNPQDSTQNNTQKKSYKSQEQQKLDVIKKGIHKEINTNKLPQRLKIKIKQKNEKMLEFKNTLTQQFAEVFEQNLWNHKQNKQFEQKIQAQEKIDIEGLAQYEVGNSEQQKNLPVQVSNQLKKSKLEKTNNDLINQQAQQQQIEQNQFNQEQKNNLPDYVSDQSRFSFLRTALQQDNYLYPQIQKRFLNYIQMNEEEYDNLKTIFSDIPPEFLPQVILEQHQITKELQKKQQVQQQIMQNQQQQFQNPHQQQRSELQNQLNFIESIFKFNPELSESNLECAICSQNYVDGDKLAILLCIHRFHLDCFTCWAKKSKQCPICHHS